MSKIYKQIQHRCKLEHASKEMKDFIKENHPEIKDTDMIEIIETRSFELNNTWDPIDVFERRAERINKISHFGTSKRNESLPDVSGMYPKGIMDMTVDEITQTFVEAFKKSGLEFIDNNFIETDRKEEDE